MDKTRSEPDRDLDRGIEPLRTVFALGVLILGLAAGARAETVVPTTGRGNGADTRHRPMRGASLDKPSRCRSAQRDRSGPATMRSST